MSATRGFIFGVLLAVSVVAGWQATSRLINAGSVDSAFYVVAVALTNDGVALDDLQVPFNVSGSSLIDDGFLDSDALNSLIHDGSADVAGMPPTARIGVAGAVGEAAGVFTEYTSEATNATADDVPLLPAAPAVGDAVYFGLDNPARIRRRRAKDRVLDYAQRFKLGNKHRHGLSG